MKKIFVLLFLLLVPFDIFAIMISKEGYSYYLDYDGTTYALTNEKNINWLCYENNIDGTPTWFGIDNRDGSINSDFKFWVKYIYKDDELYDKYVNEFSNPINPLLIYGLSDEEGNIYHGSYSFFIEIGEEWDIADIRDMFMNDYSDETAEVVIEMLDGPGSGKYARVSVHGAGKSLMVSNSKPQIAANNEQIVIQNELDKKDSSNNNVIVIISLITSLLVVVAIIVYIIIKSKKTIK